MYGTFGSPMMLDFEWFSSMITKIRSSRLEWLA
jgi:hypothetical protein